MGEYPHGLPSEREDFRKKKDWRKSQPEATTPKDAAKPSLFTFVSTMKKRNERGEENR